MEYILKDGNKSITLSEEDVRNIYEFKKAEYIKEDILSCIENSSLEGVKLEDVSIDDIVDAFERIINKHDDYFEIYWLCIEEAIKASK